MPTLEGGCIPPAHQPTGPTSPGCHTCQLLPCRCCSGWSPHQRLQKPGLPSCTASLVFLCPAASGKTPLFLGTLCENVVATGLHLQTMAWTQFELGKVSLNPCAFNPHSLPKPSRAPRGRARNRLWGRALRQHLRQRWQLGVSAGAQRTEPWRGGPGWGVHGHMCEQTHARGPGGCACQYVHVWVHAGVQSRPSTCQRSWVLQQDTYLGALH